MGSVRFAICCLVLVLSSCASQTPKTTAGLGDLPLQPSQYPGTLVYRAPDIQSGKYKSIFIDKADIYRAADAEFGGASEEDKVRLAEKLSTEFRNALTKHHYTLATQAGEGVVRLHLILAGVKESKPVASTVLRLTPLGLGASAAKTLTGASSALVGSVTVSGELLDTQSGEALAGFVATESPIALDISSGLGKLRAAELGIERGSEEFAVALDQYLHRSAG
ncbi:MAG: DUF3313 domain-containing protein [Gammaproteobacteria bacterium]|nr:DUF3313 domain-containing protein [Gammaproteobacteria bacterium]MBV8307043.1 DUF3313 domain-containing protein [Gammaproteobacteria bacterium]MBV8405701.1 DUF3313 domain-containing protein [Gammaproteobacteria bacterium]